MNFEDILVSLDKTFSIRFPSRTFIGWSKLSIFLLNKGNRCCAHIYDVEENKLFDRTLYNLLECFTHKIILSLKHHRVCIYSVYGFCGLVSTRSTGQFFQLRLFVDLVYLSDDTAANFVAFINWNFNWGKLEHLLTKELTNLHSLKEKIETNIQIVISCT